MKIIGAKKEPKLDVLKENKRQLTSEERDAVMSEGAVWHHGPNGEESPAVWKSVVDGKDWFITNTHRAYQCKTTLSAAINAYHNFIKSTAGYKPNIKLAGPRRIKDRGIEWKEHYHERSVGLKKKFDKILGKLSYIRWEGHDYTTDSDYFIVVGPAVTKDLKKRFFAGIKKLPDDPKAPVYAPSGEYFSSLRGALAHAADKWAVVIPRNAPNYTVNDLIPIEIPRHVKG